jgi:hypothetical protein
MEEGSEVSEDSEDAAASDVLESSDVADDPESSDDSDGSDGSDGSDDSDTWDSESSEGAGWFADPDVEGQERYFDGSEWTSESRPADVDTPLHHLPDHAGELQRALAAATNDIDDVEDRLGNLFDRAQQQGERGGRAREQAEAQAAAGRAAEGKALAESTEQDEVDAEEEWLIDDAGEDVAFDDDDDALADLDEALASEEPEKVKKGGLFRRRS